MRSIGMALVLFLIIKTFFFEAFQIASGSMTHTLLTGDFLFVNKALYGAQIPGTKARLPGFRQPARGDVIVFAFPRDPSQDYVKRVIGTPGDTVAMRNGHVLVNDHWLSEPYVQRIDSNSNVTSPDFEWQRPFYLARSEEDRRRYHPERDEWGPLVVPGGKYFVLGDNRDDSSDSRYWGFVDAAAVKGRTLLVYFSYDRGTHDPVPWLQDIRWSRLGSLIH
ncbi:MAG TPA: signal peptidase I [Candidatus Dormibacteraeota bacterium]|jgi:signal peptidase I